MDTAAGPGKAATVVTAHRFELVDPTGRTRAVLGDTAVPGDDRWTPGLSLFDDDGTVRMCVELTDTGPAISILRGGNIVAQLGVIDAPAAPVGPGPYVVLCHHDGAPAWSIRVDDDGAIRLTSE